MNAARNTLVALLGLAGLAAGAGAQNALGDGRALDNNLNTRSRYNSSRPSLQTEFAFRNAVVTGNAPGGLSFRGDVGYRAPSEFRGEVGSNDLFAFRRDSLLSGVAGMGIRGTEALQYQLALTTGARPPSNIVGTYRVGRTGGVTAGDVQGLADPAQSAGLQQRPPIDPEADTRGTMLWMLRSPSAYISNSSLQTSALRQVSGEGGDVYTLTASPLRGVRLSPVPELAAPRPGQITDGDDEQTDESAEAPFGTAGLQRPNEQQAEDLSEDQSNRIGPVRTMHRTIMDRLIEADEAAANEDVFGDRKNISQRVAEMVAAVARGQAASAESEGERPADARSRDEGEEDPMDEAARRATQPLRFDPETARLLRGDGTPINQFVDPSDASRDVFAEHLKAGQELLADGRYFDAEERFAHALAIKRGDVTAQLGRLHSQIGAGLFLSASLNLQSLAATRPEVFAARYAPELLPSAERIDQLVTLFRDTLDPASDRGRASSPQVKHAAGLLMAYLGYQTDRPELVREGLDDFRARHAADTAPGQPLSIEARLGEMLRTLWLPGEGTPGGGGDD